MTRLHPRLEAPLLLEYYKMLRRAQIEEACTFSGREATVTIGGFLTTEDISAPPYLKVFIVVHLDVVLSKFEGGRRPQITDPTHW